MPRTIRLRHGDRLILTTPVQITIAQISEAKHISRPPGLRKLHHELLDALTTEPVSARRLAALAGPKGHPFNSDVRTALSHLDGLGLLRHTSAGYQLT